MGKTDYDVSVTQAAAKIGVCPATVRRLVELGLLPARVRGFGTIRKRVYFRRADVDRVAREYTAGVEVNAVS